MLNLPDPKPKVNLNLKNDYNPPTGPVCQSDLFRYRNKSDEKVGPFMGKNKSLLISFIDDWK
jgi:hypothetical protein